MKRFLVLFFVLIFVSSVYAACTPGTVTTAPCNAECDGIKIEDKCYDCGADDGVCPRDFGVNCDSYPDCDDCNIDKTKPECTVAVAGCTDCSFFDDSLCDSSSCNNIKCYWFKNTLLGIDLLAQNYCTYCVSGMTCEDYEFKVACEKDNCAITNCEWNNTEGCIESTFNADLCGDTPTCDIYENEDSCDRDPCEVYAQNALDVSTGLDDGSIDISETGVDICSWSLDKCNDCYLREIPDGSYGCFLDEQNYLTWLNSLEENQDDGCDFDLGILLLLISPKIFLILSVPYFLGLSLLFLFYFAFRVLNWFLFIIQNWH